MSDRAKRKMDSDKICGNCRWCLESRKHKLGQCRNDFSSEKTVNLLLGCCKGKHFEPAEKSENVFTDPRTASGTSDPNRHP